MKITLAPLLLALPLMIAACATSPTPYGAATDARKIGFSEQRIETGRYRVSYIARDAERAQALVLRRAAELTVAEGASWFEVTDSYIDAGPFTRSTGTSVGIGVGGGSSGRVSTGVGVGLSLPLGGPPRQVEAVVNILAGTGEKPEGAQIYDADEVLVNTAGLIG